MNNLEQLRNHISSSYLIGQKFTTEEIYQTFREGKQWPHGTVAGHLDKLKQDGSIDNSDGNPTTWWRLI